MAKISGGSPSRGALALDTKVVISEDDLLQVVLLTPEKTNQQEKVLYCSNNSPLKSSTSGKSVSISFQHLPSEDEGYVEEEKILQSDQIIVASEGGIVVGKNGKEAWLCKVPKAKITSSQKKTPNN